MIHRYNPPVWLLLFLFVMGLTACEGRTPVDNEARIATRVAEELAVAATLTASVAEAQPVAIAPTDTPMATTEAEPVAAATTDTPAVAMEATTVEPTATNTPAATNTPVVVPGPIVRSRCGNATAPPRLVVGERALMVDSVANTLRSEPRRDGSRVGTISRGALVDVLDGPVCDQSTPPRFYYWLVRTNSGVTGWTAEGEKGVYWLEPAENADAPSSTGSELAINLRPSCGKQQRASRADQVTLNAFWGVKGYDLALMSDEVVNIAIQLDGQRLASSRLSAPLSEFEVPCGTGLRDSYWLVESAYVGQLGPGQHRVTVRYTFGEQVTDGFDDNGDGRPDSYGPGGDTEQFATEYVLIVQ